MNNSIQNIKKARIYLLNNIADLSAGQLNETPAGFNNNIIWNLAHLVAAEQGVCYLRAGAAIVVEEKYYSNFKPGTRPEKFIDDEEVEKIKELLLSTPDRLAADQQTYIFDNYKTWTTRYGADLSNVNDAVTFLLYHEGLHAGVIMALKKLVTGSKAFL